jgi:hypothetical protein
MDAFIKCMITIGYVLGVAVLAREGVKVALTHSVGT